MLCLEDDNFIYSSESCWLEEIWALQQHFLWDDWKWECRLSLEMSFHQVAVATFGEEQHLAGLSPWCYYIFLRELGWAVRSGWCSYESSTLHSVFSGSGGAWSHKYRVTLWPAQGACAESPTLPDPYITVMPLVCWFSPDAKTGQ